MGGNNKAALTANSLGAGRQVPEGRNGSTAAGRERPGTKPDRDLVIDLARFFCLALVVASHTMMVSPVLHPDGTVTYRQHPRQPALVRAGGLGPPGHAAVLRRRRHHRSAVLATSPGPGRPASDFMQARLLRLIRPAAVLLAIMFSGLCGRPAGRGRHAGHPAAHLRSRHAAVVPRRVPLGAAEPPMLARLHARAPWLTLPGSRRWWWRSTACGDAAAAGVPEHGLPVVRRAAARVLPRRRRPRPLGPHRARGIILASNLVLGLLVCWVCIPGTCW